MTLVLSGDGENGVFASLVRRLGVGVTDKPVGSLESRDFHTYSAWQVDPYPEGATPLLVRGLTVGCQILRGRGEIWVLADGGFFLSKNLEMEGYADRKNIRYVASLLGRKGGP